MKYVEIQELEKIFVDEAYFSRNLFTSNIVFLSTKIVFCDIINPSAKVAVLTFSVLKQK